MGPGPTQLGERASRLRRAVKRPQGTAGKLDEDLRFYQGLCQRSFPTMTGTTLMGDRPETEGEMQTERAAEREGGGDGNSGTAPRWQRSTVRPTQVARAAERAGSPQPWRAEESCSHMSAWSGEPARGWVLACTDASSGPGWGGGVPAQQQAGPTSAGVHADSCSSRAQSQPQEMSQCPL